MVEVEVLHDHHLAYNKVETHRGLTHTTVCGIPNKLAQKAEPLGFEIAETTLLLLVHKPEVLRAATASDAADSRVKRLETFISIGPWCWIRLPEQDRNE